MENEFLVIERSDMEAMLAELQFSGDMTLNALEASSFIEFKSISEFTKIRFLLESRVPLAVLTLLSLGENMGELTFFTMPLGGSISISGMSSSESSSILMF